MTAASRKDRSARSKPKETSTPRIRKILQPPKQGTVSISVIRKAVKELIEERSAI